MVAMFNILFIVHYYLFFDLLFVEINHLFLILKYLYPVAENNYLALKEIFLKISRKYR